MALHLSYATKTYRPPNGVVPGNDDAQLPVEFDLAPAEGPDLARLKSILVATSGLVADMEWTPSVQQIVVSAFQHGAPAFVATVTAVRNLTVPAAMALRVGLIETLPTHVPPGGQSPVPNPAAPVPIRTGFEFARVCSFISGVAMAVANEILQITNASGIDARFFEPPSGSGGQEMPGTTAGSANAAQTPPDAPATAGSPGPKGARPHGTSHPRRSH